MCGFHVGLRASDACRSNLGLDARLLVFIVVFPLNLKGVTVGVVQIFKLIAQGCQ